MKTYIFPEAWTQEKKDHFKHCYFPRLDEFHYTYPPEMNFEWFAAMYANGERKNKYGLEFSPQFASMPWIEEDQNTVVVRDSFVFNYVMVSLELERGKFIEGDLTAEQYYRITEDGIDTCDINLFYDILMRYRGSVFTGMRFEFIPEYTHVDVNGTEAPPALFTCVRDILEFSWERCFDYEMYLSLQD